MGQYGTSRFEVDDDENCNYCAPKQYGLAKSFTADQTSRRSGSRSPVGFRESAFILSRLDYCNSVLAGLPRCTTEPLQRVLNAAVRLVLNLQPRDHITPALQQLHWLPIEYRITYKTVL